MDGTSGSDVSVEFDGAGDPERSGFKDVLRRLRLRTGLTQEALAERAGLSERGISDLERGVRRFPHQATLELLADALMLSDRKRESFFRIARRPPSRSSPAPDNLPIPLTSFVGREVEVASLRRQLLSDNIRLVTLTGAAGAGKTRLALEVARSTRDRFVDGVCFVELASVADPSDVRGAILSALLERDGTSHPSRDTLVAQLQQRRMLLLLDNFEHVTGAASATAELLRECPGLKALVTSRVALRLAVERIHEVSPLSLPDNDTESTADTLRDAAGSEAVRLFVERASALDDRFEIAEGNADVVAGICHRLDGLPLAIELAAARIRVLSPEEMLDRLERPLDVLSGGARETPLRQRTLRSMLEWSENLLGKRERQLFARLAVFPGGCDLQAIEAVCADEGDAPTGVMEQLSTLVDNSLVTSRADEASGRRRFGMLETVRAYALERLREDPQEYQRTRRNHAAFYLRLSEEAASGLLGADEHRWYRVLELEHANIRAALAWAREYGEAAVGLRLAVSLWRSWEARGQLEGGMTWLRTFLALKPDVSPQTWAEAHFGAGMLACALGSYEEAEGFLEECLVQYQSEGDDAGVGRACNGLGVVAMRRGDYAHAEGLFGRSLAITREMGDERGLAIMVGNLGIATLYRGDVSTARRILSANLTRCRSLGLAQEVAESLNFLGFAALYDDDVPEAIGLFEQGLDAARDSRNLVSGIESARGLGCAFQASGRADEAEPLLAHALRMAHQAGDIRRVARGLDAHGCLAWARGERERAVALWTSAEQARAQAGVVEHPVERTFLEKWRFRAGASDMAAARSVGAAMTVDESVAFALESGS